MYVICMTDGLPTWVKIRQPTHSSKNDFGAVAIVASAGGISALIELLAVLGHGFALPIIIGQHLAPTSILPRILAWHCGVCAKWAEAGEMPESENVYIAPPGHGVHVGHDGFDVFPLSQNPRGWLCSPDILLQSLAVRYEASAIGVVLSGSIACGIDGLRAIQAKGGLTFAQNKKSSIHFVMPQAAVDLGKADIILSPRRIAQALNVVADQRNQQ